MYPRISRLFLFVAVVVQLTACSEKKVATDDSRSVLTALGVRVSTIELPKETSVVLMREFAGEVPKEVCEMKGDKFQVGISSPEGASSTGFALKGSVGVVSGQISGNPFFRHQGALVHEMNPSVNAKGEYVILSDEFEGKPMSRIYLRAK